MADEYKTIDKKIGEGRVTEKRSKFLAFAHYVTDSEQVRDIINDYRKRYHDARHVCFAYILGPEQTEFRAFDDGEPSSTGGKPILGRIKSLDLTDVLVVVVRYYGGANLGTSLLAQCYRDAAEQALADSNVVTKIVEEVVTVTVSYAATDKIIKIANQEGARIRDMQSDMQCTFTLPVAKSKTELLCEKIRKNVPDAQIFLPK